MNEHTLPGATTGWGAWQAGAVSAHRDPRALRVPGTANDVADQGRPFRPVRLEPLNPVGSEAYGGSAHDISEVLSEIVRSFTRHRPDRWRASGEGRQVADNRVRRTAAGRPATRAKTTPARQRARERIAAERAARKRAEARRRFLAAAGAVIAVLAIVTALVVVKLTASPAHQTASESAAPAALVRQVTTVPAAILARTNSGQAATLLQRVQAPGSLLTLGGKPAIVFVSEESCPFCAAERWALTVALSHFGTWSQLGITKSSATEIYPNTATLSFRMARYRSADLTLSTTELTDNVGHPLQPQTPLDASLIASYDVPRTSTVWISQAPCPSSTSGIGTSWPGRSTTPRCWPDCPRFRSPASSATHPLRWHRQSTDRPT
jgi:Domain of unknown function (DUF929)